MLAMSKVSASLSLFNAVLAGPIQEARYSIEHGIIIDPAAAYCADDICEWYKENQPSGDELNKSFFKSWKDAENTPLETRLVLQLTHYFSTYGLESMGLYDEKFIFTPKQEEGSAPPKQTTFKVVKGLPKDTLVKRCFKMLNKGALKRETIDLIFQCLLDCGYVLTGTEQVSNKEAKILLHKKTGTLPLNGDELFRYLVYDATGESLVIKNDKLINLITHSDYILSLNQNQRVECAKSFNRFKPLWLAFKKANERNQSTVNEISRLSKTKHVPLPVNVLGSVTSRWFTREELEAAVQTASPAVVIRAINACKQYEQEEQSRSYRIRNGKQHCQVKAASLSSKKLSQTADTLLELLKHKITPKKVYLPKHLKMVMPTSEKNFTGNYPSGTKVLVPSTDDFLLVGIYWEGEYTDIDLSGISTSKVGWDSSWKSKGLLYSGDVTSAPKGASEWLYAKELEENYLVTVNLFRGNEEQTFRLIIGYGSGKIDSNYIIDPNKVVFSCECRFTSSQMTLGTLTPTEDGGAVFTLTNLGAGTRNISQVSEKSQIARAALKTSLSSMLPVDAIHTVVSSPTEADVDLSNADRDTVLSLLN